MDPQLIGSLTKATDYLLRSRPGVVSVQNIVRISQYYGFETFNENNRLTIAGKIILIDLDYESDTLITKIGISLLIEVQQDPLGFVASFGPLLHKNLHESTLHKFNDNLKKLSVLDKFSSLKIDMFNYLNQFVLQLDNSQLQINLNDNLGFYLPIHESNQYLNSKLGLQPQITWLEVSISESSTALIHDLPCSVVLTLSQPLYIPQLALIKLAAPHYELMGSRANIPYQYRDLKVISSILGEISLLSQIYVKELGQVPKISALCKDWCIANDLIFKDLLSSSEQPLDDLSEYLNLDQINFDTPSTSPTQTAIELNLVHNKYLQINVLSYSITVQDASISSSNPNWLSKLNKLQDLYRIIR